MESNALRKLLLTGERFELEAQDGLSRYEVEVFGMTNGLVFYRVSSFGYQKYAEECTFLPFDDFAGKFEDFAVYERKAVKIGQFKNLVRND